MDTAGHRHWQAERDADDIVWLTLDQAGSAVNTLAADVVAELDRHLVVLEKEPPRGLVIRSGKAGGFIAGADIKEFLRAGTPEQAAEMIRGCHTVFDRLESLSCPTLSLIRGYCLGGGMELACQSILTVLMNFGFLVFGVTDYAGKLLTPHYGAVVAREPRNPDDQAACRLLGRRLAEWTAIFVHGQKELHPAKRASERQRPGKA